MRDRSEAVDILAVGAKIKGRDEHPAITPAPAFPGKGEAKPANYYRGKRICHRFKVKIAGFR